MKFGNMKIGALSTLHDETISNNLVSFTNFDKYR